MSDFKQKIREDDSSAIIEMIKDAHKVSKIIGWPGKPDIKVKMRLLTLSETRISKVQNQQEFKKDGLEIGSHNWADYREQECVHGMWRILLDPETDKPIFNSAEDLRSFCTTDELNAISAEYNAFADENDPSLDRLSNEDYEALVDTLKKTPDLIPKKVLSLPVAWKLLHTLVARQTN